MNKSQLESYLQNNPFEKISDIVFELLREEIISLNFKPGQDLNISKIAQDLNISRTPVRDAVLKLNAYGLVKKYSDKKGFYVSGVDAEDIIGLFYARTAVENKAAYLCAQFKKCPNIERLNELAIAFKESFCSYDITADCDHEFHKLLVESCGNAYLNEFYSILQKKVLRYSKFVLKNISENYYNKNSNSGVFITQHITIVNAIKQNMPDIAEKAMADHINIELTNALIFINNN